MRLFFDTFAQLTPETGEVISKASQAAVKLSESSNSLVLACGLVLFLLIAAYTSMLLLREKDKRIEVEKAHGEEVKSILTSNTDAMKSIENSLSILANRKQVIANQNNQNPNNQG